MPIIVLYIFVLFLPFLPFVINIFIYFAIFHLNTIDSYLFFAISVVPLRIRVSLLNMYQSTYNYFF